MDIREIIEDNTFYQCVEAYNTLNEEFHYYDNKVYHYDEILQEIEYRIENEPSAIESILIDFVNIGRDYNYSTIQDSYFVFNGYGNIELIEDDTIKEYLYNLIVDNFNEDKLEDKLKELFLI